ncbi:hypothetical protein M407DRAFT_30871 [Tulasnella calospora MUT 4182]|uniref:Uncharacterized protein n=1 Tax=Tulasnella calospora MUT 4182 TaxID=1051891 RepID=A0A0C3KDG2_9AGAM|nr:hypothetical protein M407DRAFT_30871 [Tulasnella calospora MUT 4182]
MAGNILRALETHTRGLEALYTPTIIWVDSDSNDSSKDSSPLAVLIVLTVLVGVLLVALILMGIEAWKRSTGRRPMFNIPGIGYIVAGRGYDDERVSTPLDTIHTRPPSDIPATPTVIPPTPPPPVHLGGPSRIDRSEVNASGDLPPARGFVHPQRSAESSDSFDSGLGEVHHGRRISFSRAPASLRSSYPSLSSSRSRSHPLSIFRGRVKENAETMDLMGAHATSDNSRDLGDLTILVSPPTPSTTSNASSVHLPASKSARGKKFLDFSPNRTARQVNSRHTLLLNDLNLASNDAGKIGGAYQRAAYDRPEDLYSLATSQPLSSAPSRPNCGDHTDSFLPLPHRHDDGLAEEGRLPSLDDRYDPENTDPFRKSSPEILPIAHEHIARSATFPTFSSGRKHLSMHSLVQHMMAMPTSNSQLSVANSGAPLRSYFSPSSTILPLPPHEEESFLAKSTTAVKKVWKSALGFRLGRKTGSESHAEEREEILQEPTCTTSLPELPPTKAPSSAGSKSPEDSPSLSQPTFDPQFSITPLHPAYQEATPRSPMADSSNLSKYYTPAANLNDLKKMKTLTSQSFRTPSKINHHSRVSSSPFFLQAPPRVVPLQETTRDVIGDEPTSKHEDPGPGLSERIGSPNSLSSAYSDDRSTSILLSSAGLSEFPSPPLDINFGNHQRRSSEFTLDRNYRLSEPLTVERGLAIDTHPVPQETSIYDEWNSYLPTSPRSLEDLDPRLFERSNLSIPIKQGKLSGDSPVARESREDGEDGEDGEVIGSMRAGRDDRSRPDAPLNTAFTPFQTSTPVKSGNCRNPSEKLG